MILILKRHYTTNYTMGILTVNNNLFFTLEPPHRNNKRNISCIPEAEYIITKYNSNKFKNCFKVNDVKDRSDILIHSGNTIENTSGCILIGNGINVDDNNFVRLTDSKKALNRLNDIVNDLNELRLIIE